MKKDKQWVKDEATKKIQNLFNISEPNYFDFESTNKAIRSVIDQLDEPEVLSQEWIDSSSVYIRSDGVTEEYVHVDDLKKLLVPKQELPAIPQFVADWVESRDYYNVYKVLQDLSAPGSPHAPKDVRNWIFRNQENAEKFVRAWLDGYTVGEEPKYNVRIKSSFGTVGIFLFKQDDEVLSGDNFKAYHPKEDEFRLTEQEIRGFQNGDVLFEHFAVRVEELDENGKD